MVTGSVKARSVVIDGKAKVSAEAIDSIQITGCAEFSGNANAKQINVETGAVINAKLTTNVN